jgi:hypothetical protein
MAISKVCPHCGKSFVIKRASRLYCSIKCKNASAYNRRCSLKLVQLVGGDVNATIVKDSQ